MIPKQNAAESAVAEIKNGMIVGLGTGSTAFFAISAISEQIRAGLDIKCVATSLQTEMIASQLSIPLMDLSLVDHIDIDIDGADEVDTKGNLIKGGGGALLREKIIASNSRKFIVIIHEDKLKEKLGSFQLPVEVISFGIEMTIQKIKNLGCNPVIRIKDEKRFITDNGNLIVDCHFELIKNPSDLNTKLHQITGVVETGLFSKDMVGMIMVGKNDGSVLRIEINND